MSIKKIAEIVGVSPATVSRVLNKPEYKCSSLAMREKIWKTAIELNYTPNEAARNLKKGMDETDRKNYSIGVLMTRMDAASQDSFFAEILRIIESEIHNQLCVLSQVWYMPVFSNDRKCKLEDLDKIIDEMHEEVNGSCDGLIIIGKCNENALKKLKQRYKNIVSVNRNSTNYEVDEVLCDGRKIAGIAVEYLVSLGHREIGYVGQCHNESRYKGYMDVLYKHDIELNPDYIMETNQIEAEGFEVMKKLLQAGEGPSAIYCANDITAIGMLKCLNRYKNRNYNPSIISSDDIEEAQFVTPMLTTVRLPKDEMGKFAVYLLLERLRGEHKSVVRLELEGKLMVRSSCRRFEDSGTCEYYI